jgi:hypothetical protein
MKVPHRLCQQLQVPPHLEIPVPVVTRHNLGKVYPLVHLILTVSHHWMHGTPVHWIPDLHASLQPQNGKIPKVGPLMILGFMELFCLSLSTLLLMSQNSIQLTQSFFVIPVKDRRSAFWIKLCVYFHVQKLKRKICQPHRLDHHQGMCSDYDSYSGHGSAPQYRVGQLQVAVVHLAVSDLEVQNSLFSKSCWDVDICMSGFNLHTHFPL